MSRFSPDLCSSSPCQDTDINHELVSPPPLPSFDAISESTFVWGVLDGRSFSESIISCYNEIVHWRQNVFKVPTGKVGNLFVPELARLFQAYADSSAMKSVALYAAMVMPSLLLQKPYPKSKSKDHNSSFKT